MIVSSNCAKDIGAGSSLYHMINIVERLAGLERGQIKVECLGLIQQWMFPFYSVLCPRYDLIFAVLLQSLFNWRHPFHRK